MDEIMLYGATLAGAGVFTLPFAYALWRGRNPPRPPPWSFEPHKTHPGDIVVEPKQPDIRWAEWVDHGKREATTVHSAAEHAAIMAAVRRL